MLQELSLVMVRWLDAEFSEYGWQDSEEFNKWCNESIKPVQTVGWLIRDTEEFIVVLSTMDSDSMSGAVKIPKTWVIRIEKLTREATDGGHMSDTQWSGMEHPPS